MFRRTRVRPVAFRQPNVTDRTSYAGADRRPRQAEAACSPDHSPGRDDRRPVRRSRYRRAAPSRPVAHATSGSPGPASTNRSPWSPPARPARPAARCSPRCSPFPPGCSSCRRAVACWSGTPGCPPGRRTCPATASPIRYGADQAAAGPALARAPRRVELSLPEPLLRHFAVLDTPDTDTLGVAGGRVAARRGGPVRRAALRDRAPTRRSPPPSCTCSPRSPARRCGSSSWSPPERAAGRHRRRRRRTTRGCPSRRPRSGPRSAHRWTRWR